MRNLSFALMAFVLMAAETAAQYRVSGQVLDGSRSPDEPLAFAHILINGEATSGVVSDIDGRFVAVHRAPINSLTVSYLGYKTKVVPSSAFADGYAEVRLMPDPQLMEAVTVRPGEDPAVEIMRRVIANRLRNRPEHLDAFFYRSYNKVIFDFTDRERLAKIQEGKDRDFYLFMMESVSERRYAGPHHDHELVVANRVSGFQSPTFAALGTSFQPLSFYDPVISILDQDYLNPISPNATRRYDFELKDTLFVSGDTVFQIAFEPMPGKKFDGLKGFLQISSHRYGVSSVKAEPAAYQSQWMRIRQRYQRVGEQWFPDQLDFWLSTTDSAEQTQITMESKSYIRDVEINPEYRKRDFSSVFLEISDSATRLDAALWQQYRPAALSQQEARTYQVIDSLGRRFRFDDRLNTVRGLTEGRLPLKWVDIRLLDILTFNAHEGLRLGMGLQTSEQISKRWVLGGFAGYGFKDKTWKYGGDFALKLWEKHGLELDLRYANTLLEVGRPRGEMLGHQRSNLRDVMGFRFDRVEQQSIGLGWRALRYGQFHLSANRVVLDPTYDYTFLGASEQADRFGYSTLKLRMRYAYGQKTFKALDRRVALPTRLPVLDLVVTRAIGGLWESQMDFYKVEARLTQSFRIRMLGRTQLSLSGGWVDRSLPYGLLFTGDGVNRDRNPLYVENYFQTMRPYEFLADQFAAFRLRHSFEGLLLRIGNFEPHISVEHAMRWGDLRQPNHHQQVDFAIPNQIFFESGIVLDNLLSLDNVMGLRLGYGVAIFARYGAYSQPDLAENFVIRLSTTIEQE